jgi:hypothetical protein
VDPRRSTVDLDSSCFNPMAGRDRTPTIAKFQNPPQTIYPEAGRIVFTPMTAKEFI